MLKRIFNLFLAFITSLLLYIIALSISVRIGDSNIISRIAQLILSFLLSSLAFILICKIRIDRLNNKRLGILLLDLTVVSFFPFRLLSQPVAEIFALSSLILIPYLVTRRNSLRSFKISLPGFTLVRFCFAVIAWEKELKVEDIFFSTGIGVTAGMAYKIASRRARKILNSGKVVIPSSKMIDPDIAKKELVQVLFFVKKDRIFCMEEGMTEYEGYVDARIVRFNHSYSISILGSEPYILTEEDFAMFSTIYRLIFA